MNCLVLKQGVFTAEHLDQSATSSRKDSIAVHSVLKSMPKSMCIFSVRLIGTAILKIAAHLLSLWLCMPVNLTMI